MPFEFHNPHACAIDCTLALPIGTFRVMPGTVLPTPEQEKEGLTADLLKEFEVPNLLRPTPPVVRRRLFQEHEIAIPADVVAVTAHLEEFGGEPQQNDQAPAPVAPEPAKIEKPRIPTKHVYPDDKPVKIPGTGIDVGDLEEAMVVSSRIKKPVENP
jgi:hypothetical protein